MLISNVFCNTSISLFGENSLHIPILFCRCLLKWIFSMHMYMFQEHHFYLIICLLLYGSCSKLCFLPMFGFPGK